MVNHVEIVDKNKLKEYLEYKYFLSLNDCLLRYSQSSDTKCDCLKKFVYYITFLKKRNFLQCLIRYVCPRQTLGLFHF